jgi:hypothetical protein
MFYNGPVMVSTGVDSRDGNTVGDDRKSSKTINAKSAFKFYEVDVAVNDSEFALAA